MTAASSPSSNPASNLAATGPLDAPSSDAFRRALRPLVGQVSVITCAASEGGPAQGITLTSAAALTTQPPMLIACINRSAAIYPALQVGALIGWQALGAQHQMVAEHFSGQSGATGAARFNGANWQLQPHGAAQVLLLGGAALACAAVIETLTPQATHSVLTARIISMQSAQNAGTLAYREGGYLALPALPEPGAPY